MTPFGLTGAPATFQRYINHTLKDLLDHSYLAYIDDILIYSSGSKEDHMKEVEKVLSRLRDAGLGLDLGKCEFAVKETKYLGFIIEAGKGVRIDPQKVLAIQEWEAPKTLKGVRSFLGFANFYRTFIPEYSAITRPLTALTKKGTPFRWDQEQQGAFEHLKRVFTEAPVLAQWDADRQTVVETDCSGHSLGGCLSQYGEDGLLHPIAYHSRKLSPAEFNYEIHDKELLAVMDCLSAWDGMLRSVREPFEILTDHKNLEYFRKARHLTERQARWAVKLERYSYKLHYRPGKLADRPDALSRREQDEPDGYDDKRTKGRYQQLLKDEGDPRERQPAEDKESEDLGVGVLNIDGQQFPLGDECFAYEDLQTLWNQAIKKDPDYRTIVADLRTKQQSFSPSLKGVVSISECKLDPEGRVRFRDRIWIPAYEPLRTALIQNAHDSHASGHPGRDGTIGILNRSFFWPGLTLAVRQFLRNCDTCGKKRVWRDAKQGLLKPLPVPDRFHAEISIDFITDLPTTCETDLSFLMVITDRLSKEVTLEAMTTMEAEACAETFVRAFWRFHGFLRAITSDRGSNWTGRFWTRLCQLTSMDQRLSTAFHPETDGATERANQEVLAYLRSYTALTQHD